MRLVSCALLGATLVLVCLPQVRGDEKKPTWRSLRAQQVLLDDELGEGSVVETVTRDGGFSLTWRNARWNFHGAVFSNADFEGKLTDDELARLVGELDKADLKRRLLKPQERASAHEPGFGSFTLTIEYEDHSTKVIKGEAAELPGLQGVRQLMIATPEQARNPGELKFTFAETGPVVGDAEPWTLDFAVAKDGALEGHYKHLRGTPSGRRNGSFHGSVPALAQKIYTDTNMFRARAAHATKGTTFVAKASAKHGALWSAGFLEDYPEMAALAKALGDEGGRLDAQARVQIERAGLAPPSVPESIAETYDGPIDPAGVIAAR